MPHSSQLSARPGHAWLRRWGAAGVLCCWAGCLLEAPALAGEALPGVVRDYISELCASPGPEHTARRPMQRAVIAMETSAWALACAREDVDGDGDVGETHQSTTWDVRCSDPGDSRFERLASQLTRLLTRPEIAPLDVGIVTYSGRLSGGIQSPTSNDARVAIPLGSDPALAIRLPVDLRPTHADDVLVPNYAAAIHVADRELQRSDAGSPEPGGAPPAEGVLLVAFSRREDPPDWGGEIVKVIEAARTAFSHGHPVFFVELADPRDPHRVFKPAPASADLAEVARRCAGGRTAAAWDRDLGGVLRDFLLAIPGEHLLRR